MKTFNKIILLSILTLILASCNTFAAKPTETPIPAPTSLPTLTPTAEPTPTPTQSPTDTPVLPAETASAPVLPMPSGKPLTNWEGIPVMPNAIAGDGDSNGYSFTVQATPDEVQQFYKVEMPKLGWTIFVTGQGTTEAILLIFMKDSNTASISIIPQSGGLLYVLLVK